MALTIEQSTGDFFPCYNNLGKFVVHDDFNEGLDSFNIFSVGPPTEAQQAQYNLTATDLLLLAPITVDNQLFPWTGNYVEITGTSNYDGRYLVASVSSDYVAITLEGDASDPVETTGTVKRDIKTKLGVGLFIEAVSANTINLEVPTNSEGRASICVSDFLKDYFRFRYDASAQNGFFERYCVSIRFQVFILSQYSGYVRVVTPGEPDTFEYKTVNASPVINTGLKHCVNAAMNYKDASVEGGQFDSGNFNTVYVITNTSSDNTSQFITYRPQTTYVSLGESTYLSILRGSFEVGEDFRLRVAAFDVNNFVVATGFVDYATSPAGYADPHAITWDCGPAGLADALINIPSTAVYYLCEVSVDGNIRSKRWLFYLKESCEPKYGVIWKNEFGAPEKISLYAPAEEYVSNEFETVGLDSVVGSPYQPGNIAKSTSSSPLSIILNTGLINSEHARWLLGIGRSTEVFVHDYQTDVIYPVIVQQQQIGTVNSKRNLHNYTLECVQAYNRNQIGNRLISSE